MFVSRAMHRKGLVFAALVLLIGTAPAPAAAMQAPPPYSAEERARAIIEPSVIYVEFSAVGVARNKATMEPLHTGTTTVTVRCSGFVVNFNGIAITDRNCAAPSAEMMTYWAVDNVARSKNLTGDQRTQFFQQGNIFTGDVPSEPPRTRISVQGSAATAGEGTESSWRAELVGPADTTTNLVALKIPQVVLPALEIAKLGKTDDLLTVKAMIASGYSPVSSKALVLRSRSVNVGARSQNAELAFKLEEEMPWESRGGVVADMDGRAIGILAPDGNKTSALLAAEAADNQLKAAGVTNELSQYDRLYREALEDYFAGRYSAAVTKFDKVSVVQTNLTAAHYRTLAAQRLESEGDPSSSSSTLVIILIILGVLLAGCLTVIVIMVQRQRRAAKLGYPISASPYAYGSPVDGYQNYTYPVSVPPGQPVSASPAFYDTAGQEPAFGGFPQAAAQEQPAVWPSPEQPGQPQPPQPGT